jgi:hypothetical protein
MGGRHTLTGGSGLGARYELYMAARKFRKLRFLPAMALSSLAIQAHAGQVLDVRVTREGMGFQIGMHLAIDAAPPAVFRALQDYAAMMRYNPDLRAARVEPTGVPGRVRLFTAVHTCVLVFCKTMHQAEVMTAIATANGGVLEAQFLPRGDFKAGRGRWTVRPCSTARAMSCMDVWIELVPAFWVPPVIGSWVIRRKMVEEARYTSAGLELMARHSR